MSEQIVRLHEVSKCYGDFVAVDRVSFSIEKGECFGLLGPNGAGKSSLITCLYGAAPRSGGDLQVFGMDPEVYPSRVRARLGVVTQDDCLDEGLDVESNMRIFTEFYSLPKQKALKRIDELLEFMSLSHKRKAGIRQLSGGMKRRLVFVRALLGDPEFLILDEPTTGLDPAVRHLLWEKVGDLKSKNKSILLTTHYMEEAERLCERLVIMSEGKIVAVGRPSDLIRENCPGYVCLFDEKDLGPDRVDRLREKFDLFYEARRLAVRAASMEELTRLCADLQVQALMIRPANLEDVFLKLTGKELTQNA